MKEIWKDVKGYNGIYKVSNEGFVKSSSLFKNGKLLKNKFNNVTGYYYVSLYYAPKKSRNHSIHRLVAEAFIINPENLSEVNHLDFDKSNNTQSNLSWTTHTNNIRHSIVNGRLGTRKCYEAGIEKTKERTNGWDFNFSKIVIDINTGVFYRSSMEVQRLESLKYNLRYYHRQGKYLQYQILD